MTFQRQAGVASQLYWLATSASHRAPGTCVHPVCVRVPWPDSPPPQVCLPRSGLPHWPQGSGIVEGFTNKYKCLHHLSLFWAHSPQVSTLFSSGPIFSLGFLLQMKYLQKHFILPVIFLTSFKFSFSNSIPEYSDSGSMFLVGLFTVSPNSYAMVCDVIQSQKHQAALAVMLFTIGKGQLKWGQVPSAEACEKEPVLTCTSNVATHHAHIKGKNRGAHAGDFSLKLFIVFPLAQTSYSLCAPGSLINWMQSVVAFKAYCLLLAQGLRAARLIREELNFIKGFKVSSVSFSFCFGTKLKPHRLEAQTVLKKAFSLLIKFFVLATTWRENCRHITDWITDVTSLLCHWACILCDLYSTHYLKILSVLPDSSLLIRSFPELFILL